MTLKLEIQEGAERHARQEHYDEYGHSIACQLRLLRSYFGTGTDSCEVKERAVYGDSWFMGVNAAEVIHMVVR